MRILEIGRVPYFKTVRPEQTDYFDPTPRPPASSAPKGIGFGALLSALQSRAFDFVAVQPEAFAAWSPQAISRMLFRRSVFRQGVSPHRPWSVEMLRLFPDLPIAVLDFDDPSTIKASQLFLLDRCKLWFKRELPVDEWKVFSHTATAGLPSKRYRRRASQAKRVAKLRPLPLGLPLNASRSLFGLDMPKAADIFYAVTAQGLPARERALGELDRLRAEGYRIDMPTAPVPREQFHERCAAAWLVLSPEGYGWDCFRHYEAAACGSVPLMNTASTRRHQPFVEGESGLYYPPEDGGLAAAARTALADKPRLERIAYEARRLTAAHHTPEAIVRRVCDAMAAV